MAFTEPERVKIRRYMGWPPGKTEPRYDSQITYAQSVSEGGSMPDGSTETEIRGILAALAAIETRLAGLWDVQEAGKVDELAVDPARGTVMLRSEGRRLVKNMAKCLNAEVLYDSFSPSLNVGYARFV